MQTVASDFTHARQPWHEAIRCTKQTTDQNVFKTMQRRNLQKQVWQDYTGFKPMYIISMISLHIVQSPSGARIQEDTQQWEYKTCRAVFLGRHCLTFSHKGSVVVRYPLLRNCSANLEAQVLPALYCWFAQSCQENNPRPILQHFPFQKFPPQRLSGNCLLPALQEPQQ